MIATVETTFACITLTTGTGALAINVAAYDDAEEVQEHIDQHIEIMNGEEKNLKVTDYDEDIFPAAVAKNIDPEKWIDYLEAYEEHGDAFRLYVEDVCYAGQDVFDMVSSFEEAYRGEYDSKEDFARELLDETGELEAIPENLRWYFDYEAYARDLFISDVWSAPASAYGGIYVYWNN